MLNLVSDFLMMLLCWGGGLMLNKGSMVSNFIHLLSMLIVWLLIYTLVENKCSRGGSSLTIMHVILSSTVILSIKTKSLFLFYIGFEASVIPITLIIFFFGYQPEKLQSAMFLLLYTVVGSLPLLLFIIMDLNFFVKSSFLTVPMTLGFMVKTPLFLLHTWLPKAHVEAPVSGSMVLAGVLLKLGTYGLLIFLPYITLNNLLSFYMGTSFIGSIVGSLMCMRQGDMKLLIAYSSVVHMGVINLGLISGSEMGYTCAQLMVLSHGLCSPFLFAFSYWMYGSSHSRLLLNNSSAWPLSAGLLFCLVSLNMSVPPSMGLWSEVCLTLSAFSIMSWCFPALFMVFMLGVAYNLFFYTSCMHTKIAKESKIMENTSVLSTAQTVFSNFASFMCLDLFHI